MATVGQTLTSPEAEWRRYNDNDSRINKVGTWTPQNANSNLYNSDEPYTATLNDLTTQISVQTDTFRSVDKLFKNFEIKVYKPR